MARRAAITYKSARASSSQAIGVEVGSWIKCDHYNTAEFAISVTDINTSGTLDVQLEGSPDESNHYIIGTHSQITADRDASATATTAATSSGETLVVNPLGSKFVRYKAVVGTAAVTWDGKLTLKN